MKRDLLILLAIHANAVEQSPLNHSQRLRKPAANATRAAHTISTASVIVEKVASIPVSELAQVPTIELALQNYRALIIKRSQNCNNTKVFMEASSGIQLIAFTLLNFFLNTALEFEDLSTETQDGIVECFLNSLEIYNQSYAALHKKILNGDYMQPNNFLANNPGKIHSLERHLLLHLYLQRLTEISSTFTQAMVAHDNALNISRNNIKTIIQSLPQTPLTLQLFFDLSFNTFGHQATFLKFYQNDFTDAGIDYIEMLKISNAVKHLMDKQPKIYELLKAFFEAEVLFDADTQKRLKISMQRNEFHKMYCGLSSAEKSAVNATLQTLKRASSMFNDFINQVVLQTTPSTRIQDKNKPRIPEAELQQLRKLMSKANPSPDFQTFLDASGFETTPDEKEMIAEIELRRMLMQFL